MGKIKNPVGSAVKGIKNKVAKKLGIKNPFKK
jgi:hypothetical protein